MWWERWRIPIMLAPTVLILIVLFFGGLGDGFLQSLGYQPEIGNTRISLDAYHNVMFGDQFREDFWRGLLLTLWVSAASTFVSAALAIPSALLLRQSFVGKRIAIFLFQINLSVPHLVFAVGMIFLFSQSGLVARAAGQFGWITSPAEFPVLVRDTSGIAIIAAYIWKELPFLGIVLLAILQSLGENYEDLARNLGANYWQRFRYVILPLVMPGLVSASIIVFAFTFGTYEVPQLLGMQYPRMLPVMALQFFLDPDLNARQVGIALNMIIASLLLALVVFYMWIHKRSIQRF